MNSDEADSAVVKYILMSIAAISIASCTAFTYNAKTKVVMECNKLNSTAVAASQPTITCIVP